MIDAPLAFAFTAGLVAAFNPCGFAMLPAYLSYFIGAEGSDGPTAVTRALSVAAVVSGGFAAVFGLAGLVVVNVTSAVNDVLPWITVVIGVALVPLGIAMVRGFEPKLALPRLQKGTSGRGLDSMFLFGVSYAVVSLSCTLPVFLVATATTFRTANFVSGMAVFCAYAAGMALVLMVLTLALALARGGLVRHLRSVLPHVHRISGALLALAGLYVAYYGFYELWILEGSGGDLRVLGVTIPEDVVAWPADTVTAWSADLQHWIDRFGPARLGLIGVALVAGVVSAAVLVKGSPAQPAERSDPPARSSA